MALKKPSTPIKSPLDNLPQWEDVEFRTDFPFLHAFLYDTEYEGGEPRMPGTVVVCCKNGVLSLILNDNQEQRTAFVNCGTWAEAWFTANEAIGSDRTEWKGKRPTDMGKKVPF